MKTLIFLLIGLVFTFSILNVSAVPQVVFTNINLSINTGNWSIQGEGINAVDNFAINGNCNFSYSRANIPITFSRDIGENNTDVAILIQALANNNNVSAQWQNCISRVGDLETNLTICTERYNQSASYEQNFTNCNMQLVTCNADRNTYATQIQTANNSVNNLQQQRIIMGAAIVGLGLLAYSFYRKVTVKTVQSPLAQLPSSMRM